MLCTLFHRIHGAGSTNANIKVVFLDGIHGTPYIAAQWILWVWLVVSIPLKNMKVNGKDYSIYSGKMFETTSQLCTLWLNLWTI